MLDDLKRERFSIYWSSFQIAPIARAELVQSQELLLNHPKGAGTKALQQSFPANLGRFAET